MIYKPFARNLEIIRSRVVIGRVIIFIIQIKNDGIAR